MRLPQKVERRPPAPEAKAIAESVATVRQQTVPIARSRAHERSGNLHTRSGNLNARSGNLLALSRAHRPEAVLPGLGRGVGLVLRDVGRRPRDRTGLRPQPFALGCPLRPLHSGHAARRPNAQGFAIRGRNARGRGSARLGRTRRRRRLGSTRLDLRRDRRCADLPSRRRGSRVPDPLRRRLSRSGAARGEGLGTHTVIGQCGDDGWVDVARKGWVVLQANDEAKRQINVFQSAENKQRSFTETIFCTHVCIIRA